jgi:nucleoside-diphosphate-sugar epimerase
MRTEREPHKWERIAVIGSSGRSGSALCQILAAQGSSFIPVQRKVDGAQVGSNAPRIADLGNARALASALADATVVISTAHARWTPQVIGAAPRDARLVLMGSTRRYSRWPDAHGDGVRFGEAAFLASGRCGVMLHPTLIYGRGGEGDVQRLASLLSRLPLAPLPGGGRSLVQPIHQGDVARCLAVAASYPWEGPKTLVIAGPEPVAYRDFLRAVAEAAGLRVPPVVGVSAGLLRTLVPLSAMVPGMPRIDVAQIRRLTEDKAFDIGPMRQCLGVEPLPLEEGLAKTFPNNGTRQGMSPSKQAGASR